MGYRCHVGVVVNEVSHSYVYTHTHDISHVESGDPCLDLSHHDSPTNISMQVYFSRYKLDTAKTCDRVLVAPLPNWLGHMTCYSLCDYKVAMI